jgi:hypothetical protein
MIQTLLSTQSCKQLLAWASSQGLNVELGTDVGRFKPREPGGEFDLVRVTRKQSGAPVHTFRVAEWCRKEFESVKP